MKPGHGEVVLTEGDPAVREDEERLVAEFRRQLDEGMWAAVPTTRAARGRPEAQVGGDYADIPPDAEGVIFSPRAAGGGPAPAVLLALLALALVAAVLLAPTIARVGRELN